MKSRLLDIIFGLAIAGLALSLLWHLSTFLPVNHEVLRVFEVPLMLGAMLTFLVSWIGLIGLLGRLGWDTGRLFARIRRHYVALIPIAACYLFLIFSDLIAPDVVAPAPGDFERDAGQPVLRSPSGVTPISEEEFQSLIAQHEREFNTGFIMMYAFAVGALYILRQERTEEVPSQPRSSAHP
jgi:hypothetical protein